MLLSINKLILSIIFLHIIIVRRQQIKKNFSNSFLKKLRYLSYNEIQHNLEQEVSQCLVSILVYFLLLGSVKPTLH